jgi:hypothetical protein
VQTLRVIQGFRTVPVNPIVEVVVEGMKSVSQALQSEPGGIVAQVAAMQGVMGRTMTAKLGLKVAVVWVATGRAEASGTLDSTHMPRASQPRARARKRRMGKG